MIPDDDHPDVPRVTIQSYRSALIASIQVDLDQRVLAGFRRDLLNRIQRTAARAVLIDLSGIEVMDDADFEGLLGVAAASGLMGTEAILCGIRPGVAAALVDLEISLDGVRTRLNLEDALAELDARTQPEDADPSAETTDDRKGEDGYRRDEAHDPE